MVRVTISRRDTADTAITAELLISLHVQSFSEVDCIVEVVILWYQKSLLKLHIITSRNASIVGRALQLHRMSQTVCKTGCEMT